MNKLLSHEVHLWRLELNCSGFMCAHENEDIHWEAVCALPSLGDRLIAPQWALHSEPRSSLVSMLGMTNHVLEALMKERERSSRLV